MKKRLALFVLLAIGLANPSPSSATWLANGTPLCTAAQDQARFAIVSDGAGGAIVAWDDYRSGTQYDIYCQRITGSGTALWTANGVALCSASGDQLNPTIVSDGAGGAIVAWRDMRNGINQDDVYVRRIDASGTPQWTPDGVALCSAANAQIELVSVSDGVGGAIIAWRDQRLGGEIYVRRVNASGTPLWTSDGVPLTVQGGLIPQITTDGAGGAIVTWEDLRNGVLSDVYAQRVDAGGAAQWGSGAAVCTQSQYQRWLAIVSDNGGGAIIAWRDERPGDLGIYAQRLNSAGAAQWTIDGVKLAGTTGLAEATAIASDGGSGAFVTWQDGSGGSNDIMGRRINATGTPLGADAFFVCNAMFDQVTPSIVTDGSGGAIIAWADQRNLNTSFTDIFAQRYNASGVRQWAVNGVLISNANQEQEAPSIVPDGSGGVIAAWRDRRNSITNAFDVYALRLGFNGLVPTAVRAATPSPALWVGNAYPNPFSGRSSFDLVLQANSSVQIDIVDVAGRRVRTITLPAVASGIRNVNLDGLDDRGQSLPSGVYFYRVRAAGETVTRKMVVTR